MGPASNASPSALPQPYPKQRLTTVIEIVKNLLPAMFLIILYIELVRSLTLSSTARSVSCHWGAFYSLP